MPSTPEPQPGTPATPQSPPAVVRGWKKFLYLSLAGACRILGAAGAVLPGLPTTPFLLLTSYFLVRSSPRLNEVLLRSKFFGPILTDWQQQGAVRSHVKAQAITVVVTAVGVSIYLSEARLWSTITVVVLATIGVGVILRLPTARD